MSAVTLPVGDETSLRGLFETLLAEKWLIIAVTFVFAAVSTAVAFWLPRQYTATLVLSVVANRPGDNVAGASSLLSQFGGLASLAGIQVRGGTERAEAMAILQSDVLTRQYIQEQNLLPILFSEKWDAAQGRWKVGAGKVPTLWQANERFKAKIRDVEDNTRTGLITMTITWTDPKLAAQWGNGLVKLTNDYMRNKAIQQSERNIAYLNDQAAKTDIAPMRQALYAILETELRSAMLARGTEEYALKVLDPAVPPERPSAPKRTVWALAGALSGFFVAVFVVLARRAWRLSAADGGIPAGRGGMR